MIRLIGLVLIAATGVGGEYMPPGIAQEGGMPGAVQPVCAMDGHAYSLFRRPGGRIAAGGGEGAGISHCRFRTGRGQNPQGTIPVKA